jgi:allophanate hydrolase subunit 2
MSNKKTKRNKGVASDWNKFCRPYLAKALAQAKRAYRIKYKPVDLKKLAKLRKQKEAVAKRIRKELKKE